MKLHIVPARTGIQWVKSGVLTFFKQPLAMAGLFFMFMATVSVLSVVPYLGNAAALVLLPAATLGLMAATQEADQGRFPKPAVLVLALRGDSGRRKSMLQLGIIYATCFAALMGLSALFDGGKLAQLYLAGSGVTREMVQDDNFLTALWVVMALYLPLSMLFWHAPALVHWHGVSPVKSLFFSAVACLRNAGAFTLYGLVWLAIFSGTGLLVSMLASLTGGPDLAATLMFPVTMLLACMFFTSIHFTVKDCFQPLQGNAP
jgi:hypothetical protein